jgi:hypothetical protein
MAGGARAYDAGGARRAIEEVGIVTEPGHDNGSSQAALARLFPDLPSGERYIAYILREHRRGRPVVEILEDAYLRGLGERRRARLGLCREVVEGVAADTEAARAELDGPAAA